MRPPKPKTTGLRIACVLTLIGLALIVWPLLDPRPVPVIVAMSVAQGIGTLAFLLYLRAVYVDARRKGIFRDEEEGA